MAKNIMLDFLGDDGKIKAQLCLWRIGKQSTSVKGSEISTETEKENPLAIFESSTYGYEINGLSTSDKVGLSVEPNELFEPDNETLIRGRIKTRNRVGLLEVSISNSFGHLASTAIEIYSRKLSYDDEYRWMLKDIALFSSEASVSRFAATKHSYHALESGDSTTLYQKFVFLKAILESDEYLQALHQVTSNPYISWESNTESRPISMGLSASGSTNRALVSGGDRIKLSKNIGKLDSVPIKVSNKKLSAKLDNIPNKFVKKVLIDWIGLAQLVQDSLRKELKRNKDGSLKRIPAPISRGLAETQNIIDNIDKALAHPVFRSISHLKQYPLANQVLIKRPGYREINRLNQQVNLATSLTWDEAKGIIKSGQRDIATLYEYWVFIQLASICANICNVRFDPSSMFELTGGGLQLKLIKGSGKVLSGITDVEGKKVYLELWFNRTFSSKSCESWSKDMRPDISILFKVNEPGFNNERWIHFDAKYKINNNAELFDVEKENENKLNGDRAARTDLLKMHAYRDSIRNTSGAYVVFPGKYGESNAEIYLEYHEVLPSLGAFPLKPDSSGTVAGTADIKNFLIEVISHLADSTTREYRSNYWIDEAMSPVPKSPKKYSHFAGSRNIINFLERPAADSNVVLMTLHDDVFWDRLNGVLVFNPESDANMSVAVFRSDWGILDDGFDIALVRFIDGHAIKPTPTSFLAGAKVYIALSVMHEAFLPCNLTRDVILERLEGKKVKFTSWDKLINH